MCATRAMPRTRVVMGTRAEPESVCASLPFFFSKVKSSGHGGGLDHTRLAIFKPPRAFVGSLWCVSVT